MAAIRHWTGIPLLVDHVLYYNLVSCKNSKIFGGGTESYAV